MRASLIRSALILSLSASAFPALASDASAGAAAGSAPAPAQAAATAAEPAPARASAAKADPAAGAAASPGTAPAAPSARRSCEEVKSGIEAGIKAKGVKAFTLDIAEKDAAVEGKVVGTCDGGTKKIVYKRG